ncbi:A/G-specific adenine glycosylase [bacterium]|jgi:A/G-specific adenine glycosylase|nr:A/G-specific adenine glycosylase [bacterium]
MSDWRSDLLAWFDRDQRTMPWRKDFHSDPYAVWVSEVMLQQTTVAAVIPFYERWMARFPTAEALAAASEEEVLQHWQGLGYYSRARNLHQGVRTVVQFGWPQTVKEWKMISGVGDYTAGAIGSIAQGIVVPAVDGNVERVFSRRFMVSDTGEKLKRFATFWAGRNVDPHRPGDWNQALMELGATVCTPKNPTCGRCPVASSCEALQAGRVGEFPAPKPRKDWIELEHVTVVPFRGDRVGLVQAKRGEWWSGLWQPPRGEVGADLGIEIGEFVGRFKHVVTRHKIQLEVRRLEVEGHLDGLTWFEFADLDEVPMSAPGRRAINLALEASLRLPGLE